MMESIIGSRKGQWQWGARLHTVAVIGLVVLAGLGIGLESSGGWIACPGQWVEL